MARRDRTVFTIMIVPHAETKVFRFRLSTLVFQAICYVLVCIFLFMIILTRSYQTMLSNMWELEELRVVNREQRDQIEQLVREAKELEQRMVILDELDKQVREMMELESSVDTGSPLASTPSLPEEAASDRASIASFGGPGAGTAIGGGGAMVSRTSILDAQNALGMLGQISREVGERKQSLEQVRQAVSDNVAYVSAKPSIWPAFGYVTSRYGYRRTAFGSEQHQGYDIAGRYGSPIVATADGTVTYAGWSGNYGNLVEIEHGYGWSTAYGHCAKIVVKVGDRVKRGQVIAFIGSTGRSTGPHVHYEVRVNGKTVNPRYYLGDHD